MLPNDPVMLMSVINTKLRDFYPDIEALCGDMDISAAELTEKLEAAGFVYDREQNRFKAR
ncbi:MAG: DUF4250 domain-containing protein [Ruminococcus sp.]|nr:DUF4250 domain-containing protein [Ruminococcus sp.]